MKNEISLRPGSEVCFQGRRYIIVSIPDFDWVLAKDAQTSEAVRLQIKELAPPPAEATGKKDVPDDIDLALVSDADWQIANFRMEIIAPLLDKAARSTKKVEQRARLAGVDKSTVYRWIERFEAIGKVSSFLPEKPCGGRGKSRLPNKDNNVINETIKKHYLEKKPPQSIKSTIQEVNRCLRNAGLPRRHPNTIRARIALLSDKTKMAARSSMQAAEHEYSFIRGSFPGADYPLAVIQIDHTDVDIILVNDVDRLPVGRPKITLGIDVFSRMVAGFYVSFDPVGAISVGLCIAHSILPKEKWLASRGLPPDSWPLWGKMSTIHADNAREFHGTMLKRACREHNIDLVWRPVKRPHYGGHIERLAGTLMKSIHSLPGTTFSNPTERGEYDSEKHAAMTLSEFEKWLALRIQAYHNERHGELQMSPLKKFESGIFGTDGPTGRGLPPRIYDEQRIRLDFTPYYERTIQDYGIVLDEIHYYHDVLSPWIKSRDDKDSRRKRKFLLRRDPRDISVLYFYDPEVKQYYEIPYRDKSRPPISVWELRAATRTLKERGIKQINETLIFDIYEQMRVLEEKSVHKTKKMRRAAQRRALNKEARKQIKPDRPKAPAESSMRPASETVAPFDDVEII